MSQHLATRIERDVESPLPWRSIAKKTVTVVVAGITIFTPGEPGIVEAGVSALLILAGVPGGDAVVATLAYRINSYWRPIVVGPFADTALRLRYGRPGEPGGRGAGSALATG